MLSEPQYDKIRSLGFLMSTPGMRKTNLNRLTHKRVKVGFSYSVLGNIKIGVP